MAIVTSRMDDDEHEILVAIAALPGLNMNKVLNAAVKQFIKKNVTREEVERLVAEQHRHVDERASKLLKLLNT